MKIKFQTKPIIKEDVPLIIDGKNKGLTCACATADGKKGYYYDNNQNRYTVYINEKTIEIKKGFDIPESPHPEYDRQITGRQW